MLNINKILVPTDLSAVSVPAIGYALSLAKDHGAEVIVLHTVAARAMKEHLSGSYVTEGLISPAAIPAAAVHARSLESLSETKRRHLHNFLGQKIASELLGAVKVTPRINFGKVVEEIVATAKEEQCDLIVMTSRGSRLRHLFHGSFTERVVHQAPCPVLSIQPAAELRTEKDKRVQARLIEKWAA